MENEWNKLEEGGTAVNTVYRTTDYSIFMYSQYNRSVHLGNEMLEQAKQGIISPVIVNENMVVIDGQHRLEASKQLGKPVEYIVKPGLTEKDIIRMNTTQHKWNYIDFAECFANAGKEEYIKLLDLIDKHVMNYSVLIQVAMNSKKGLTHRGGEGFKTGDFKFADYEKCLEFLDFYQMFSDKTGIKRRSNSTLALYELFKLEKFEPDRLIHKIFELNLVEELSIRSMTKTYAVKTFLDIYNHKLTPKSPIYINYHIDSQSNVVIDEHMAAWARLDQGEALWNSVTSSPFGKI